MPQKLLIIDDAVPFAKEIFGHLGEVVLQPGREISAETVAKADAIIVRSRTQVNESLLANSKVKFVGSTVVGLDHVDQVWLQENNIEFYSAQGCNANSVAEFVISGIFQLAEDHKIDLSTQTLGIIGVGNVGKLVQQKAQILGIKCLLNDPPRSEAENSDAFCELDYLLANADIITLHTPLVLDGKHPTLNLLNAKNLALTKDKVILINAARGEVIDETAWLAKIQQQKTSANLIDCWQNEPYINEQLYFAADYATAHIAGHSLEAKINGAVMCYQALCEFWGVATDNSWQEFLPASPDTLKQPTSENTQQALAQIFQQAYDLAKDDQAIRNQTIEQIHKQFETYRRNYPVRREWKLHKIHQTESEKLNKLLKNLGFTIISNS